MCDLCKKEIHKQVYRINIVAFPADDKPESARALDDDWANEVRKMDLCYECLTDTLREDTSVNFEGGVPATHSSEPAQEPDPQPEPAAETAEAAPDDSELTEEEEQAICDRIAGTARGKKQIDLGKLQALWEANRRGGHWTIKEIADDLKCSEATVYYHLKKMGLRKG